MRTYLAAALAAAAVLSGCSIHAPRYNADFENVQQLRLAKPAPANVVAFEAGAASVNSPTLRGNSLVSPSGTFVKYVEEALRQELREARLLDEASTLQIGGTLLTNDVDATGLSIGTADMSARIVVRKGNAVVYDQVHKAHHEWPSDFVGGIAIPRAAQEYPGVVKKLLRSLYADPQFIAALKG